jgi:hypothetical protein
MTDSAEKTCKTCQDYSHKFKVCFCPFNATAFGYMFVNHTDKACFHYREGKNDYTDITN